MSQFTIDLVFTDSTLAGNFAYLPIPIVAAVSLAWRFSQRIQIINKMIKKSCKYGGVAQSFTMPERIYILQLPLRQWGASNVYLLVLSSWKVNIAENPIAITGL